MRVSKMLAVMALICMCFGLQTALAEQPNLGALNIAAIKSMQIYGDASDFYIKVEVILQNSSENDIKLKNTDFDVKFSEKNAGETVSTISKAHIDELIIPGKTGEAAAGETETTLTSKLGPKNMKTTEIIIQLLNIIGNPSNNMIMLLEGTGEAGSKVNNGWIYQTGMKAELEFAPQIQKEILFK